MTVVLPPLAGAHHQAWLAILGLAARVPEHWALIGGQMVMLHCWDRGVTPSRPTEDGDAVVDVRADPAMLDRFTGALVDLGFTSAGVSPSGHEHRWVREEAVIDVLLPDGIGERAQGRTGRTGSTTLTTPGGTWALAATSPVTVTYDGQTADVPVPHLAGALLVKARAWGNTLDVRRERHALDLAVLCALVSRQDNAALGEVRGKAKPRRALAGALQAMLDNPVSWIGVEGAAEAVPQVMDFLRR